MVGGGIQERGQGLLAAMRADLKPKADLSIPPLPARPLPTSRRSPVTSRSKPGRRAGGQ